MTRLLIAVATFVAVLLPAAPAAARDDGITLTVGGDGAAGVTVLAAHTDGRAIQTELLLVLTGTGAGGRTVGPVQLHPSGEGRGFYAAPGILAPGRWQIVVTANQPGARAEATVLARVPQTPAPVAAPPSPAGEDGPPWSWLGLAIAAVVATIAGSAVVLRTRAARAGSGR